MKKVQFLALTLLLAFFVTACSSGDQAKNSQSSEMADVSTEEFDTANKSGPIANTENADLEQESQEDNTTASDVDIDAIDRKIIYTANLRIEVKSFQKSLQDIQTQIAERDGYIVESNMYGESGDGMKSGFITARIPQERFREFIQVVEKGSSNVLESSISGQDVTEEYVDLESRLKSKRAVEERLLTFMDRAEKTEDLLKISEDLAKVQGEIEELLGRMKYIENKTDLATVTIQLEENNVTISGMNKDELNTWDRTKQQFLKSINWLLSAFSGLIVFFIGSLPVLILLGFIGLIVFFVIRKIRRNRKDS